MIYTSISTTRKQTLCRKIASAIVHKATNNESVSAITWRDGYPAVAELSLMYTLGNHYNPQFKIRIHATPRSEIHVQISGVILQMGEYTPESLLQGVGLYNKIGAFLTRKLKAIPENEGHYIIHTKKGKLPGQV